MIGLQEMLLQEDLDHNPILFQHGTMSGTAGSVSISPDNVVWMRK